MKSLSVKLGVVLFIIVLAIFGNIEVWGADWKLFHSDEEAVSYHDAEGITRPSRNTVKVWVKKVYTKEGVIGAIQKLGKRVERLSLEMHLFEINCAEKNQHSLHSIWYSEKGEVIHSDSKPGEWTSIVPESIGEMLYKAVCK